MTEERMTGERLKGRTVLVVEDEYFIAVEVERELVQAGATVLGPVASLEKAIDLIKSGERIDGAVLDVSLRGEMVFPAADLLHARSVPFVLATGYDASVVPSRFDGVPRLEKPIGPVKLSRSLADLFEARV